MPKLEILGGSGEGRSKNVNASRTINLYPELDADPESKAVISLVKTPGTGLWATPGGSVNREMHVFAGLLYVVSGNKLYSVASNGTVSAALGTLLTSTGRVSMSDNGLKSAGIGGNQLMIVDGLAGYIYDVVSLNFQRITSYTAVQAELELTVSAAAIEKVTLTSPGSGYGDTPTVTVTDPTGTGAVLKARVGYPLQLQTVDYGAGYYLPSGTTTVTITDPTGTGAVASPIIYLDPPTGRSFLTGIQITNGGKGYSREPDFPDTALYAASTISAPGAAGFPTGPSRGALTLDLTNGAVLGVDVIDGGSGYTDPAVVFTTTAPVVPATATASISMSIASIKVTKAGSGYIYPPTITIEGESISSITPAVENVSGDGTKVTVVFRGHGLVTGKLVSASGASVEGYNVSAVVVTVIDSNTFSYPATGTGVLTAAPTISYPEFGTTTATATLANTGVASVSFEGGTGYSEVPTVSITAPEGTAFPDNPTTVTYFDGYFIVTNGTMSAWASELYNGLLFNPLATSPIQSAPDTVQMAISVFQQVLFIKQYTSEWFYDAAVPTSEGFPLARVGGGVIPFGTRAPWSVCRGAGTVFWLADQWNGESGEFIGPVMLSGGTPTPIGSPAIVYRMGRWSDIKNAFSYCYSEAGHTFVVWTSPGDDDTFVYDVTTQMWHERSTGGSTTLFKRHVSNSYAYFGGKHLVGDWQSGKIYQLDPSFTTDNGAPIVWLRRTPHLFDNDRMDRLFITRLLLDADITPSTGTITLAYSKDNGTTFPFQHVKPASGRLVFHRLGMSRDRVWQISGSDSTAVVLTGGYAEVEK